MFPGPGGSDVNSVGNNGSRQLTLTDTGVHADSQLGPENDAVLFASGSGKEQKGANQKKTSFFESEQLQKQKNVFIMDDRFILKGRACECKSQKSCQGQPVEWFYYSFGLYPGP